MDPRDLFGVIVRSIGLLNVLNAIPMAFANPYVGAGYAVVVLLFGGGGLASLFYPRTPVQV
jgi:hypothetical protein